VTQPRGGDREAAGGLWRARHEYRRGVLASFSAAG